MSTRISKILGGFLAAAIGDAMGAATEIRTTEMIKDYFGGYVKEIINPPEDTWAHGTKAGMVTDDFSISFFSAEEICKAGGQVTEEVALKALMRWSEAPQYSRFCGPTTLNALKRIKGEEVPKTKHDRLLCVNSRASNGAPMKVGSIGLFNAGDVDKAIDDAIILCKITHDNTTALSGAAAIAAATARAMDDRVSWCEVVQAGIYGAREGFERAKLIARPVATASVERRINLAVEVGMRNQGDWEKAMVELSQIIGGGLPAAEAVPAAFGYIVACEGDPMQTLYMAVNAGDDTDTVGCMVGYIVGALGGIDKLPMKYLYKIEQMNGFDLQGISKSIDNLLDKRESNEIGGKI
ncbi:MAG: hypothetical protein GX222_06660 [Ruminococcaceae bacterium]|nr:hypothetical protein [Oscillospiraceae bacterium]